MNTDSNFFKTYPLPTVRSYYALSALIILAHAQQKAVPLHFIVKKLSVSLSYFEQIFGVLQQHKLVQSIKGPGGGYKLAQDPKFISISSVIKIIDAHSHELKLKNVQDTDLKTANPIWKLMGQTLHHHLNGQTLGDFIAMDS
jgi:Rrf2 family iron-sulfur cluster assembly transcriptional regulator